MPTLVVFYCPAASRALPLMIHGALRPAPRHTRRVALRAGEWLAVRERENADQYKGNKNIFRVTRKGGGQDEIYGLELCADVCVDKSFAFSAAALVFSTYLCPPLSILCLPCPIALINPKRGRF